MVFIWILWSLVWGGLFTGLYNLSSGMLASPFSFIQGIRSLFPIIAIYLCLMWIFLTKKKIHSFSTPLGLFFVYGLIGLVVSFLSPDKLTAMYWGGLFLSPIIVLWVVLSGEEVMPKFRAVLIINYIVAISVVITLLPETFGIIQYNRVSTFYSLPFGMGDITKNGAGRFALIVIIISMVRILTGQEKKRYLWIFIAVPSFYLLMQTQSRTALLGLAVATVLIVLIRKMRWQFLLIGPVSAFVLWTSGYKWRAQQELAKIFELTGRKLTWQDAVSMIKQSPFLGWGFHADRLLLDSQHVHNSYLHALIHSGILGSIFFVGAIILFWYMVIRTKTFAHIDKASLVEKPFLIESLLILGALTARSFFESTAAFYGVDLLFFLPAMTYVFYWMHQEYQGDE